MLDFALCIFIHNQYSTISYARLRGKSCLAMWIIIQKIYVIGYIGYPWIFIENLNINIGGLCSTSMVKFSLFRFHFSNPVKTDFNKSRFLKNEVKSGETRASDPRLEISPVHIRLKKETITDHSILVCDIKCRYATSACGYFQTTPSEVLMKSHWYLSFRLEVYACYRALTYMCVVYLNTHDPGHGSIVREDHPWCVTAAILCCSEHFSHVLLGSGSSSSDRE